MTSKARGFTLIELLVVVAIIALLIAILLPSLARARQTAKTVLCASNMKAMGQIIHTWAGEYDGRAVGSGTASYGSLNWAAILTAMYLRDEKIVSGTYRSGSKYISLTQGPTSRSLTCPNFQAGGSRRQYALNEFVNGGPRTAAQPGGRYGMLVIPSPQPYRSDFTITEWNPSSPTSTGYRLGAKLDRFSPYQFMIVEQDYPNDVSSSTSTGTGKVTLGGNPAEAYPLYSKLSDAKLSFRHPYFEKANFLFVDAHVEVLSPNDDVWSGRRFDIPSK